jgi:chromosome segregation ATPase
MEGNGQTNNESRLDRLEDAYNLMIRDHEEFRQEHKALLKAQVVMYDEHIKLEQSLTRLSEKVERVSDNVERLGYKVERLGDNVDRLGDKVDRLGDAVGKLSVKVEDIGDKLNGLIAWSEQTRKENEIRFRRLEEKH